MEKKYNSILKVIFLASIIVLSSFSRGKAGLLYTRSQYKKLYNEKIAVEIELSTVKRKFKNEKSDLLGKIKKLEAEIESLNKQLDLLNGKNEKDKKLCNTRIEELKKTIDILKKKSGNREQNLISENKKLQKRYEKELQQVRDGLIDEKKRNIKQLADLKKFFENKITELNRVIKNLNEELSTLKKLTRQQKEELRRMEEQALELEKKLKKEIAMGQIRLKKFHDKLIINLDDKISFASGSAKLKKEILPALKKITTILISYPEYNISIEGHTDNVPIRSRRFRDNWQLSTERALSVLGYILKNKKLNRSRFGAAGYGPYRPIVNNDTDENRALNRRVDIVVIPRVTK